MGKAADHNTERRPMRHRRLGIAAVGIALAPVLVAAAWAAAPATQATRVPPIARHPEYTTTSRPTEEMLGRDMRAIILPSEPGEFGEDRTERSGGAIGRVVPEQKRLPEGYVIASREAQVTREGAWVVLNVASVHDLPHVPPLRVLPNQRLATLETIIADKPTPPPFLVTGRITEFHGHNYILIENLAEPSSVRPPTLTPAPPGPVAATSTAPAREPTAEEVVRQLMEQRPRRAIVLPDQIQTADTRPSEAGAAGRDAARWSEDTQLVDRPARIVPGDPWWMLALDDLGQGGGEDPVRLLPNQVLETALALTGGGTRNIVLIVSGELTVYRGTNYLLLRKVLVRRDLGNFR